jgi:hypothetical protein
MRKESMRICKRRQGTQTGDVGWISQKTLQATVPFNALLFLSFRYHGYVDKDKKAILTVFCSNEGLFTLKHSSDIFIDGTFKVQFVVFLSSVLWLSYMTIFRNYPIKTANAYLCVNS